MTTHNVELLKTALSQLQGRDPESPVRPTDFRPFGLLNIGTLQGLIGSVIYECERAAKDAENLKNAEDQARAQVQSICEMVAAVECDYSRLEELRDERSALGYDAAIADQDSAERELAAAAVREWDKENGDELAELESQAGDCTDEDDARERLQEDPLSVEVRSGWCSPGETASPEEFTILLCTGGPAVRIMGELDENNQPCRAWIEYQDWFTPWTELVDITSSDRSAILTYCQSFYFGE